jgi:pyruvate/2-oxoglutarate/acetoin dehydrogenase E1 component/TPP-dependent pyruvate/acetoin dehydrogenase alpha subunit
MAQPALERSEALALHRTMVLIRVFESRVEELFKAGKLPGFVHTYLGEEAIAAGVCSRLGPDDYITSTHRGHGHALAKGMSPAALMAELYGRAEGACRGRGGSMHVADFSLGMLGANGIVGGGFGIAAGAALAARHRGTDHVAVCFFGDGGINKGTFHEALNFASVHRLGVVYVCENNQYAQFTARSRTTSVEDLAVRATAYGMAGATVDGNDMAAVSAAAAEAVQRARDGEGPTLLNMVTYRLGGHYVGDAEVYRDASEVEEYRGRDPIQRWEETLADRGWLDSEGRAAVYQEAAAAVRDAEERAEAGPFPDADSALDDVFTPVPAAAGRSDRGPVRVSAARDGGSAGGSATPGDGSGGEAGETRRMTFGQATVDAMASAMRADDRVVALGEDISWGGNFGQFRGLVDEFGPGRVIDMPISEAIIVAVAVGAATAGLRPVASMSFVEFTLGAMDEIVNQASKFRYMFGGQVSVPLVLRASDGVLRSSASQHSSSLEGLFTHLPGLKVVAPSNPSDAKGLLRTAIDDPDPVIYLEHKKITAQRGPVPTGDYRVPLGSAAVTRPGADVTVVSYSAMALNALAAAERLASDGIDVDVIDLRSLVPLDFDTVVQSVARTRRAVVAHEAWSFGGFGAELAAQLHSELFGELEAPVARVGAASAPIPFSPPLEAAVVPGVDAVEAAVRAVMS